LRSLQEIQPDFEEEAKAYAGLWSQGKKKKDNLEQHGITEYKNKKVSVFDSSISNSN
jgi:hypothetical protein